MATTIVRPVSRDYARAGQNRIHSALLLAGAVVIVLPFALAWSFCLVHVLPYLIPSNGRPEAPPWLILALSTPLLAIPVILFARLASSPLRTLPFCGPVAFRTPALEARQLLEKLARKAGLPVPRLYVIETLAPNAFSAGVKPSQAIVGVTRGLLDLLNGREMEAVLAHELSHIGNYDTRWNTVVAAVARFLRLPFRTGSIGGARRRNAWHAGRSPLGILLLPLSPAIVLSGPPLALVLGAVACPDVKQEADREAVDLTGDPGGLMSALIKIKIAGSTMPESDPVVAHLYFVDPGPQMTGIMRGHLFVSHPPIDDRIAALEALAGEVEPSLIENATAAGLDFVKRRDGLTDFGTDPLDDSHTNDLAFLAEGNRAFEARRVSETSDVHEEDRVSSPVVARVARGDLVIASNQASEMQQIITADGKFGFLPRSVKLIQTNRLPQDVLQGTDVRPAEFLRLRAPLQKLTRWQVLLVGLFGFVVFVAVITVMSAFR